MAKKAKKKASKKKSTAGSRPAVYLIKQTEKGGQLTPEEQQADIDRIHNYIKKAGGTCSLFGNEVKNANEFVSIIGNLTPARQRQMIAVIEQSGNVKSLMLHIFKG